jgi:hypothetical protein
VKDNKEGEDRDERNRDEKVTRIKETDVKIDRCEKGHR